MLRVLSNVPDLLDMLQYSTPACKLEITKLLQLYTTHHTYTLYTWQWNENKIYSWDCPDGVSLIDVIVGNKGLSNLPYETSHVVVVCFPVAIQQLIRIFPQSEYKSTMTCSSPCILYHQLRRNVHIDQDSMARPAQFIVQIPPAV